MSLEYQIIIKNRLFNNISILQNKLNENNTEITLEYKKLLQCILYHISYQKGRDRFKIIHKIEFYENILQELNIVLSTPIETWNKDYFEKYYQKLDFHKVLMHLNTLIKKQNEKKELLIQRCTNFKTEVLEHFKIVEDPVLKDLIINLFNEYILLLISNINNINNDGLRETYKTLLFVEKGINKLYYDLNTIKRALKPSRKKIILLINGFSTYFNQNTDFISVNDTIKQSLINLNQYKRNVFNNEKVIN